MLSATSKYALKMLLELARMDEGQFIRVVDLAKKIRVPAPYLAKLVKHLVRSGYLQGRKGPGGGVAISPAGRNATFYEICENLNEPLLHQHCFLSHRPCDKYAYCSMHKKWSSIRGAVIQFLTHSKICEIG